MPKEVSAEKKCRIVQGTKIPVARDSKCLFKDVTNLHQRNIKGIGNMKTSYVYKPTPKSSKDSGQPVRFHKLQLPIAETQTRKFSNINININFTTTVGLGSVKPAVDKPAAPFLFSGSDQLEISPIEKMSNQKRALGRPSLKKVSTNVHQGFNVEDVTKKFGDSPLKRHKEMYKSRYARNRFDGNVDVIRMNRRFDLLMKFREDQMDAARAPM